VLYAGRNTGAELKDTPATHMKERA
jgi:hypothetical protein